MSTPDAMDESFEYCDECERDVSHRISIEIREESEKSENASFSREPYRVSECCRCGTETVIRMNNA